MEETLKKLKEVLADIKAHRQRKFQDMQVGIARIDGQIEGYEEVIFRIEQKIEKETK